MCIVRAHGMKNEGQDESKVTDSLLPCQAHNAVVIFLIFTPSVIPSQRPPRELIACHCSDKL